MIISPKIFSDVVKNFQSVIFILGIKNSVDRDEIKLMLYRFYKVTKLRIDDTIQVK